MLSVISKNCAGSHLWLGWYFAGQRKQSPEARRCWSCSGDKRVVGRAVAGVTKAGRGGRLCGDCGEEVTEEKDVGAGVETRAQPSLSSISLDKS